MIPIEQEDIASTERVTSAPARQVAACVIARTRLRYDALVDGDWEVSSAESLFGKRGQALNEQRALGQIAARRKPIGQRLRRPGDDEIGDSERPERAKVATRRLRSSVCSVIALPKRSQRAM